MASAASSNRKRKELPDILGFGLHDFKIDVEKNTWSAKCNICKRVLISDTSGTTSGSNWLVILISYCYNLI